MKTELWKAEKYSAIAVENYNRYSFVLNLCVTTPYNSRYKLFAVLVELSILFVFSLSGKTTVFFPQTPCSGKTLCAIARHVNWKIVIKFLRNKDEVKSGKIASIFGQALQRKFAENIFSKRRRLKGLPKLYKKNDKVKYFFNVTDLTSGFKTNFITKIL